MAKKTKKESPVVEATTGEIATKVEERPDKAVVEKKADSEELNKKVDAKETESEKDELKEKAIKLFKSYPSAEAFYFTSDGTAFLEQNNASNHGKSLTKKEVRTIKRKEA
ncbi:MAG: hypothetical protein M0Q90_14285 [Bacteroidales bacterium]|nr:hypothetical protein [Bacteroidales bacterium]